MLGEELRKAREQAGMTQEQLAFESGLSRPYISQLEHDMKSPRLDTFFLLCDALGISAEELIGRVDRARKGPPR